MAIPKSKLYAAIFGFLLAFSGYFFGVSATTYATYFNEFKQRFPQITDANQQNYQAMLVSAFIAGAVIAAAIGGLLITFLGKRRTLLTMLSAEIVVLALHAIQYFPALVGLRVCAGFIACLYTLLVPGMIFETLPESMASTFASLFGTFLCAGLCTGLTYHISWSRLLPAAAARLLAPVMKVLPLTWQLPHELVRLLLFAFVFKMESPASMVERGCTREQFYDNYCEMYDTRTAARLGEEKFEQVVNARNAKATAKSASTQKTLFLPVFLAALLNILNQVTGINLFAFYSFEIFQENGCDPAETLSLLFGVFGLIGSIATTLLAARFRIRTLIVFGMVGQAIGQFVMIAGFTLRGVSFGVVSLKYLIVVGPYLYNFAYSFAQGGLMYAYCGRLVSSNTMSLCVLLQWALAFAIGSLGLRLRRLLGDTALFFGCQLLGVVGSVLFIAYAVDIDGCNEETLRKRLINKRFLA